MLKKLCAILVVLMALASMPVYGAEMHCGVGLAPCATAPVEGFVLLNTQTTGAATTAVVVTLTAVAGVRSHVYSVEARCNTAAATSDLAITDGGTTIWTTPPLGVVNAATNFQKIWNTGLTGATNSAVVITLAACTAGTGTLIVQADKW